MTTKMILKLFIPSAIFHVIIFLSGILFFPSVSSHPQPYLFVAWLPRMAIRVNDEKQMAHHYHSQECIKRHTVMSGYLSESFSNHRKFCSKKQVR